MRPETNRGCSGRASRPVAGLAVDRDASMIQVNRATKPSTCCERSKNEQKPVVSFT